MRRSERERQGKGEGERGAEGQEEDGERTMELGEKEGAESTSERDKSARKSGGYVRVSVIKGRDRRRGERERDKSSDSQVEGNERDAMEGAEYDGRAGGRRWWRRRGRKEIKKGSGKDERRPMAAQCDAESLVSLPPPSRSA